MESDELLDTNESKIFNAAVIWLQHNLQQQKQLQLQSLQQQELSTSESQVTTSNKSGRGLSGRASRNPAKSSGSITGSTNNNQHSSNEQSLINAVLQHVRLPLIDCFVLSNQIKTHSFMRSPDQISRLLQAFELYCLR